MKIISFDQMLSQICFITLFLTTVLYWGKVIFSKTKYLNTIAHIGMIISNGGLAIILLERWVISNHAPLSNLYESSIFLVWAVTLLYLLLQSRIQSNWAGAIIAPSALLIKGFATFGLPLEMQQVTLLVPALQSNWLMMHVSMMILSYSFLLSGSLLSVALLVVNYNRQLNFNNYNTKYTENGDSTLFLQKCFFDIRQFCLVDQLDNWSYKIISIGFPFLTIGILSGAVWANEAWGSYWSWDPKETWAFITWLTFAIYLHTRMIKGWSGQSSAIVASLGLFIIWACYLGVNLLEKGLHSYGWLT